MIKATIIADSVSKHTGTRLTTFELEYPRFIHVELLTNFNLEFLNSSNSTNSHAIPIDKMIELMQSNPATPIHWGQQNHWDTQTGQAEQELPTMNITLCKALWQKAARNAVNVAKEMKALGLHEQVINHVLEPFQIMRTIVTTTETHYENFFSCYRKTVLPETKALIKVMCKTYKSSKPEELDSGEWHTPYIEHTRNPSTNELQYSILNDEGVQYLTKEEAIHISSKRVIQMLYYQNNYSSDITFKHFFTPSLTPENVENDWDREDLS